MGCVCTVCVSLYGGDRGESFSIDLYEQEYVEKDVVFIHTVDVCAHVMSWLH